MSKYHQSIFKPKNPEKYKGNPTNIICRSSWERVLCNEFDRNPSILQWSSEEIIVNYVSPIDGRKRRYFTDFWIKKKDREGNITEVLIEVKPKKQTQPPKPQKRATKNYINEVTTWGVNQAKWEAAEEFCRKKGWSFQILTEDEIFGKSPKKNK